MGKTEKGAIWLNENLFSSYDYWQFWRNTDDRDVKKFLNFFTDLILKKLRNLCKEQNINKLKILLANEATKLFMEKKQLKKLNLLLKITFEGKGLGIRFA